MFDQATLQALVARELAKDRERPKLERRAEESQGPELRTLTPFEASLLGGAMDGISTFKQLSSGAGREDNAMFQGLPPSVTGAIVAAQGPLLHMALKKKFPKLANMISAQMGAHQLGLGGENLRDPRVDRSSESRLAQKLLPTVIKAQ